MLNPNNTLIGALSSAKADFFNLKVGDVVYYFSDPLNDIDFEEKTASGLYEIIHITESTDFTEPVYVLFDHSRMRSICRLYWWDKIRTVTFVPAADSDSIKTIQKRRAEIQSQLSRQLPLNRDFCPQKQLSFVFDTPKDIHELVQLNHGMLSKNDLHAVLLQHQNLILNELHKQGYKKEES